MNLINWQNADNFYNYLIELVVAENKFPDFNKLAEEISSNSNIPLSLDIRAKRFSKISGEQLRQFTHNYRKRRVKLIKNIRARNLILAKRKLPLEPIPPKIKDLRSFITDFNREKIKGITHEEYMVRITEYLKENNLDIAPNVFRKTIYFTKFRPRTPLTDKEKEQLIVFNSIIKTKN